MEQSRKRISIVVPAYNEHGNIRPLVEKISEVFTSRLEEYDYQIWFFDNHSDDGTYDEILNVAGQNSRVHAVRYVRNFGFQRSLMAAYRIVDGDATVQLDCDLQDPPDIIPEFVRLWEQGHDLVFGIRQKREEASTQTFFRKAFYKTLAKLSSDYLPENAGDFRLTDRSILEQLRKVHDVEPYVRGLISNLATNPVGVPYDRKRRTQGESKFPYIFQLVLAITGIVSHSVMPLRIASILGVAIFFATIGLLLFYLLAAWLGGLLWPPGLMTIVVLLMASISLNCIFLGVIGEYISHIHQNTRSRPLTVIQSSFNVPQDASELQQIVWGP